MVAGPIESHDRHFASSAELLQHYRDLFRRTRPIQPQAVFGIQVRREPVPAGLMASTSTVDRHTAAPELDPGIPGITAIYETRTPMWPRPRARLADFLSIVSLYYGVARADLISSERGPKRVTRVRQVVMVLAARLTSRSFADIGYYIGQRDNASVYNALRRFREAEKTEPALRLDMVILTSILYDFFDITSSGR